MEGRQWAEVYENWLQGRPKEEETRHKEEEQLTRNREGEVRGGKGVRAQRRVGAQASASQPHGPAFLTNGSLMNSHL